ncbi:hypothetical protein WR25_22867 isoform H [Diploscapter pachys]|uniref:Uncharacterized protein n=1 Tax=Diploscapter pachys TaxID=2018661 RepID=A0A2A2K788_9BILA|nr:hypothetical protein WR25_22867 isoform B [Diploscapter pachys]PAV69762.1 hypothetical protein WR25_22867 isoform E [Diploscapter pachys]PAV69764.1 hypothetical protein WR25_22867 isoform G [Diploscapter pachys]PAV69765.1 hypothetical protein WR25_22867 isoform H [Diploscapter pachys]
MFNMKVGHNCSESLTERTDAYGRNQVLYGEITNFQRDYLLDRFYGKNIMGDRKFESVIVDEVDSMLLDKGNNVLYLSHQIAGFDKLEAVFVYIWQLVNRPVKDQADYDLAFNTARLRENVIDNMYKRITRDDLNVIQPKEKKFSVDKVWKELIQEGVINLEGRLLIEKVDKSILESLETIEENAKKRLIFLLNEATRKQCMAVVPNFLVQFVEDHLTKWIENAKMALIMMAGNDYVVDIDRTGMKNDLHANITILDRDTGTDQASSQWEEGLHQFLQLKHGCKMSLMSLKAIFISNVSYFMLYRNLFGLTGTLGSVTEMELLKEIHEVEYVTIPTARGKRFYEETPAVCQNQNSWIERIEEEVRDYLTKKRSVLVICETVERVNFVSKKLSEKKIPNIFAYRREHEEFTIAKSLLHPQQIIIATNLAGRGTDIKISDELRKTGGLHICLTYLPSNKRVEEQAFGRAARSGDPGSGRIVMIGDGAASGVRMIGIKTERDSQEIKRIAEVKDNYYEKIQAEELCFKEFQKAYNELDKKFDKDSSEKVNLQENLIDQWAFWLDKWKYIIRNDGNSENYKKRLSVFTDQAKKYPIPLDYILMPHLIKHGKVLIEEKKYKEAISFLNQVIETEPFFSEAAHYYKAYAVGKNFNWEFVSWTESRRSSRQLVISELRTAKRMFENLSDEQLRYSAVINRMKENFESTGIIQINSYEEQKKNVVSMYGQFISSIDDAIGSMVTAESFCKGIIDEPMSAALYEELMKKKVLRPMRMAERYDTKSMENICLEYGIPLEKMKSFLEKEKGGDHNEIADRLKSSFTLPNRDDFWQELLSNKWLINQKTYVIVDETKLCEEFPLDFSKGKFEKDRLINFKKEMEESTSKIAKTSEQLNEIGEKTIFERETFKNLFKYVSYDKLLRKNLLIEMEVAERSKQEGVISFVNFDKLKKEHFALENIESTEVDAILTLLLNSKLISQQKDCYSLNAKDLSNLSLPSEQSVYTPAMRSVLQSSFAYRLAFNRLLQQIEEKSWPVKIPLVHKPQQGLLWDLVYAGVLCPVQVEKDASAKAVVEDSYPEYFSKDALTSLLAVEIPGLSLSKAWDLLKSREFLKEALCSDTYTIKDKTVDIYENKLLNNKMNTLLRSQMVLRKETTRNSVIATIEQLKGSIAALEVPQPYLQWIYEALGSRADGAVEELSMFMMNGLGEVIRFKEQAYTFKMFFNTNIVILLGLLQIAAGVAITLFTTGLMTNVGTGFISEGVGDLIFAVSALRSGYFSWSSYWQHKKESIMFTVVTCGIGAFFSRGAQVSRYGAKLAEKGLEASGKSVAEMCGNQLIKEVGLKTVGKEVLKDISLNAVKGVSFGLASSQVSQIVDNHLRTLCNGLAESFLTKVHETAANHKISKTIDIVYARLGPEKGKMLIESHIKAALANKDMHNSWGATFLRYGAYVSRQIGDGLSRQKVSGNDKSFNILFIKSLEGSKILISSSKFTLGANQISALKFKSVMFYFKKSLITLIILYIRSINCPKPTLCGHLCGKGSGIR